MQARFKPHVSLNVKNVDRSVEFYRTLFGADPVKHYHDVTIVHSVIKDDLGADTREQRTGYAKFDLQAPPLNFVLNEVPVQHCENSALSHMGLQVDDSAQVLQWRERMQAAGLKVRDEMSVSCCYARQDKFWLTDPDGNEWEVFTVLDHLSPEQLKRLDQRGSCGDSSCASPQTPTPTVSACGACT